MFRSSSRKKKSTSIGLAARWGVESLERRLLLSTVTWTGAGDGSNWTDAHNWSSYPALPGASDDVTINVAGSPNVQLASGTQSIHSLNSTNPIQLRGGILAVTTTLQFSAPLYLEGGVISGGTLSGTGGADLILEPTNGFSSGNLDQVTIASGTTVDATAPYTGLAVTGGLTVNGTLEAGATFGETFYGTQTLSGTGQILLRSTVSEQGGTLTIGSGITIHGGASGSVQGNLDTQNPTDSIINNGTVIAETGGYLHVNDGGNPGTFTNNGTMAANGTMLLLHTWNNAGTINANANGTLSLGSEDTTWSSTSNTGTITATNATVNLGGTLTFAELGTFNRTGGTVNLTGTLNNAGTTLALTAATGSWDLYQGAIIGGAVSATGGAELALAYGGNLGAGTIYDGTLSGVTITAGTIVDATAQYSGLAIVGGLTLNGTLQAGATFGEHFYGTQILSGTGLLLIHNSEVSEQGGTLTIGSGITVRGGTAGGGGSLNSCA